MNQTLKTAVPQTNQFKYWDETEEAIKSFERADEIYQRALQRQEIERKAKGKLSLKAQLEAFEAGNHLDDLQTIAQDLESKKQLMLRLKQEEEERKQNLIELAAKLEDIHHQ